MRRVISMPVAIIAALLMLAGFDSAAKSDGQAQLLKVRETVWRLPPNSLHNSCARAPKQGRFAAIYRDPYFLSGIVSGVSLESTTKTANRLAGSLSLAFSLIL